MELNDGTVKVLSYYLPQFHPFKENDEWWGPGFTEWTNVGKAKPLFKGHYQPKVPKDLGYYDLRVPEVAEKQAELACKAGVTGFVYWHYWFGNGKKLMEMPAERMLQSGKPDYPFCFAWANHSWFRKRWNPDGTKDELLMEQQYPGIEDIDAHFYYCLPFFMDERYMRYNNKPLFILFDVPAYKDVDAFIIRWNELAKQEGLSDGFYFIANSFSVELAEEAKKQGFLGAILDVNAKLSLSGSFMHKAYNFILRQLHIITAGGPKKVDYKQLVRNAWVEDIHDRDDIVPMFMPNWDHTPRSGTRGNVFIDATPENFQKMAEKVISKADKKNQKLLILKSWNEWGEGNYMEPDLKYGHGFIEALNKAISEIQKRD